MKKVLIVDDSSFMRNILKDILNDKSSFSYQFEIVEANGKNNAIKQLDKMTPDVILLDIVMRESETEGVEFIREVQGRFEIGKIIVVSSVGQSVVIDECNSLGIQYFINKPFEQTQVVDAVTAVLGKAK